MQLSIIILNYNVRYFLEQCLLSVREAIQGLDAEIIVVDNNSPDNSCQMIKERFPDVILIENKENVGFPKGNNIGVEKAKGKYVCILNPDTVVAEDTFTKIITFAQNQTDLGIIGCRLIDGTGNFLPESKRSVPTPWVSFSKIFGLYKLAPTSNWLGRYYAGHLQEDQIGKTAVLVGAFMVLERELYNEVGGFDERYFMYGEDIDFSYTVLRKGKSNYYFPETSIIHYKGESTVKDGTYMKRFQQGMELFYEKNLKTSVFFSLFMKLGAFFFSFMKTFQGKPKPKPKPESYIFISDNFILKEKLQNTLKKNIQIQKFENQKAVFSQTFSGLGSVEVILDADYLTFKECISIMETNKNKNLTFKILPNDSNFIIGSNSNNERGEFVLF
ncbi:glycosyltransferase family 2 protein [Flavobacterium microcysteis]